MNTELLRDSIDRATSDPVIPPDIEGLKRRGRRRAAVRATGAAVATAAVIAAGTYAAQDIGGPPRAQALPASIRSQGPVAVVDAGGTSVLLDGQPMHAGHATSHGVFPSAVTDAGLIYVGAGRSAYLLANDGRERRLGAAVAVEHGSAQWQASAAADSSGRYAAWPSVDGETPMLNLFDSAAPESVERTPVDLVGVVGPNPHSAYVQFVRDGVVYLGVYVGSRGRPTTVAWDSSLPEDRQFYRVTDPGTRVVDLESKTVLKNGPGEVYGPSGEPLDDSWTILNDRNRTQPYEPDLTVSGNWLVRANGDGDLSATNTNTGERVDIDVANQAVSVRSDNDDSILVVSGLWTSDPEVEDPILQDCDLATGTCTDVHELDAKDPRFATGDVE